jgi:hypothetical protein
VHRAPSVAIRVASITLIPIILAVLGAAKHGSQLKAPLTPALSPTAVLPASGGSDEKIAPWAEQDDEGVVDLYGNDVSAAVATYRLDADGSLYELHSPRTQLPRLSSPKG